MARRDESGFRHGLRVRIGANGPRGTLYRCEKRGGGIYWKVRLTSGEWVWPDDLVIDGPGDRLQRCLDCRLPFMGNVGDLLCTSCSTEQFGPASDRAAAAKDQTIARRGGSSTFHRRRSHS